MRKGRRWKDNANKPVIPAEEPSLWQMLAFTYKMGKTIFKRALNEYAEGAKRNY